MKREFLMQPLTLQAFVMVLLAYSSERKLMPGTEEIGLMMVYLQKHKVSKASGCTFLTQLCMQEPRKN